MGDGRILDRPRTFGRRGGPLRHPPLGAIGRREEVRIVRRPVEYRVVLKVQWPDLLEHSATGGVDHRAGNWAGNWAGTLPSPLV